MIAHCIVLLLSTCYTYPQQLLLVNYTVNISLTDKTDSYLSIKTLIATFSHLK